jgi:hypothetical protein
MQCWAVDHVALPVARAKPNEGDRIASENSVDGRQGYLGCKKSHQMLA